MRQISRMSELELRRAKPIVESPFTLGLLTGLYPALFFISHNWFVIGIAQSFYVLLVLSLVAFLVISVAHLVLSNLPLPRRKDNDGLGTRIARLPGSRKTRSSTSSMCFWLSSGVTPIGANTTPRSKPASICFGSFLHT